jgi:myo-inositol-1(or 4)-monophosphatase
MSLYTKEIEVMRQTAERAGELVRRLYRTVERLTKTHAAAQQEAVTEADRKSQALIVAALQAAFPGDGIIGEEDDTGSGITMNCPDAMGRVWVIDPIDGTNNFIGGFDNFAVCIGLLVGGMPVAGVVYDVTRERMYSGVVGEGMTVDGVATHCLTTPMGDSSVVMLTSNVLDANKQLHPFVVRWMGQTNWKVRVIGSAALEAALVGAGIAHGAVTVNGKLWDVAAPAALVLAAGGRITTMGGKDLFPFDVRGYAGAKVPFLAAGPAAIEELVRQVNTPEAFRPPR